MGNIVQFSITRLLLIISELIEKQQFEKIISITSEQLPQEYFQVQIFIHDCLHSESQKCLFWCFTDID